MAFSWGELAAMGKADEKLEKEPFSKEEWATVRELDREADYVRMSPKQRKRALGKRKYYLANRERLNARKGAYRKERREALNARRRQLRMERHEDALRREADYRDRYRSEINARARQRRKEKPEKFRQLDANYRKRHREEIRTRQRKRYWAHREERVESSRKYRKAHPERVSQYNAAYSAAHREELNAKRRARRAANPEYYREKERQSYAAHREKRKESSRRYKQAHPERISHYNAAYSASHREELNAKQRARRAANPEHYREIQRKWYALTGMKFFNGIRKAASGKRRRVPMNRPNWWKYVHACIRDYPAKCAEQDGLRDWLSNPDGEARALSQVPRRPTENKALRHIAETGLTGQRGQEYDAVRLAIRETMDMPDGRERIAFIGLLYSDANGSLESAAALSGVHMDTARLWRGEFVRNIASRLGLL